MPHSLNPVPESSALVSSSGGRSNLHGNGHSGSSSRGFRGGCTGGPGDRKCDYCGATNHTKPCCWKKYGKTQ